MRVLICFMTIGSLRACCPAAGFSYMSLRTCWITGFLMMAWISGSAIALRCLSSSPSVSVDPACWLIIMSVFYLPATHSALAGSIARPSSKDLIALWYSLSNTWQFPFLEKAFTNLGSSSRHLSASLRASTGVFNFKRAAHLLEYKAMLVGSRLTPSSNSLMAPGKSPALNLAFPAALHSSALAGSRYCSVSHLFFYLTVEFMLARTVESLYSNRASLKQAIDSSNLCYWARAFALRPRALHILRAL